MNLNLMKLSRVGVASIKGLKCVVIPIVENDIFISMNEEGKAKSAYLGITAWANKNGVSQYGDTHLVKQSFSEEFKKFTNIESWTDREKIEEAIGKDLCKEAFRITLEFQALSNFVYVFRNFIGDIEGYEKNADVFVAKDLLMPIL